MSVGDGEPAEGKEELGAYVNNIGKVGGKYKGARNVFKTLMQEVLIFGSETWVMTPRVGWALGGFQHRVARRITRRKPRRLLDRVWEYPTLETAIQEAGF